MSKGVSKKRKNEIITLLENFNVFKRIHKENSILPNFNRKELEEKVFDNKDPISLEPFQDWSEEELRTGIFIKWIFFYKETSIKNYILFNQNRKKIFDPINHSFNYPG